MPEFRWTEELSVGNDRIDKQHQQLMDLVNGLPEADNSDFSSLFQELLRYTLEHFSDEEHWMGQHDYPESFQHLRQHQEIAVAFDGYLRDYVRDRLDRDQFRGFLYTWVREHILEHDLAFAGFLQTRATDG